MNTDHAPPIWLLDVDGVINIDGPGAWGGWPASRIIHGEAVGNVKVRWIPDMIDRIAEIHNGGLAEVRWCSSWCDEPAMLTELGEALGLRLQPLIKGRSASATWADRKVAAADNVLHGMLRRLIWTDDTEVNYARARYPGFADAERDGRALLIEPDSARGLQPKLLDLIEDFCNARQYQGR